MRRALCVGIDEYRSRPLHGCVSDANRMSEVLARHQDSSPNFDCKALVAPSGTPGAVTRPILRKRLRELFAYPADVALFHFSGHGTVNSLDGYLVTQDAEHHDEGIAMTEVLSLANGSKTNEVVMMLDCCFQDK